ncbi:MAG: MFS transporter [Magnetococcales bacterium]|nr:MFS transporter [Magnetococcales bacterium]
MTENSILGGLKSREGLLILMTTAFYVAFQTWMTLLNNFAVEGAAFSGKEIGILQSLREIPGFLAFGVVFLLIFVKEQSLAFISLILLGLGTALTGFFPSKMGLYLTTLLMSVGFHYFETVRQSLALQWIHKDRTPQVLGKIIAVGSRTALLALGAIYLAVDIGGLELKWIYLLGGGFTVLTGIVAAFLYPTYPEGVSQHKHLVFRGRYWLYYALTFMSGARRQIFVVFAGFLMVEKFHYSVADIALLFIANQAINMLLAHRIGQLIGRWGERRSMILEYLGLIGIFLSYAVVETAWIAAALFIVDHLFFAMAIAHKTYFQKIADPADIASTAGVAFSINHVAAVFIPVVFGLLWLMAPALVFLAGAGLATLSLGLAFLVPSDPAPGREHLALFSPR